VLCGITTANGLLYVVSIEYKKHDGVLFRQTWIIFRNEMQIRQKVGKYRVSHLKEFTVLKKSKFYLLVYLNASELR